MENNIKPLREERGLSQQALADLMGVHKNTVINWETAANDPRASDLVKLASVLGCTIEDVVLVDAECRERKAG